MGVNTAAKGTGNVVQWWRACLACARPHVSYSALQTKAEAIGTLTGKSFYSVCLGKWEDWNININDN